MSSHPDRGTESAAIELGPFAEHAVPVALALLVHARTIAFPFSGLDDGMHFLTNTLVSNPHAHRWTEFLATREIGYPIPVTLLSYAIDHALVGYSPWWFHLVNVVLHACNVGLVVRLARALGISRWAAMLGASWFAVHPLVVEPVSWATGRKDLLATLFALTALVTVAGRLAPSLRRWCGAAVSSLFAMISKPTTIVVPAMLWLLARRAEDPSTRQRALAFLIPLGLVDAAIGIVGIVICRGQQPIGSKPPGEVLLDIAGAWANSAGHVVWPLDLQPYYFRWPGDPAASAMVLALVGAAALVAWWWRGLARWGAAWTAFAIAALAYAPVCGVVGHHRWTADSYLYLPLAALLVAVAALLDDRFTRRPKRAVLAVGLFGALSLGAVAVAQADVWASPDRLWRSVSARYPQSPVALNELASTLAWMGRPEEAREVRIELDERFPAFDQVFVPRIEVRLATGRLDRVVDLIRLGLREGDVPTAVAYLELVLRDPARTLPRDPRDLSRALELARPALHANVGDPAVLTRLASELDAAGLTSEAASLRADAEARQVDAARARESGAPLKQP